MLALLLLIPQAAPLQADDSEQRLKALQSQIKALRQDVDQTREQRDKERQALRHIEKRIGELHSQLQKTQQQQQTLHQQLKALGSQQQASQKRLQQHRDTLIELARLRHRQGEQGQLKLLLNQQDISTLGRNSLYLEYFNQAQLETINDLDSELKTLQQLEQQTQQQQDHLTQVEHRLNQQQTELADEQQQRQQLLSKANRQLRSQESQLRQLLEDAKQLEQVVQQISRENSKRRTKAASFSQQRGKLPWPAKGKLAASFGQSRHLGKLTWEGVVISAPMGNNVRAVADGEVVFADWLRGYGLLLIVDHGQDYLTLYGHNQSLNKQVGEQVKQNEVIAAIGNSGGNDKPGLYFEIRQKGKPVNPKRWCRGSRPG